MPIAVVADLIVTITAEVARDVMVSTEMPPVGVALGLVTTAARTLWHPSFHHIVQ